MIVKSRGGTVSALAVCHLGIDGRLALPPQYTEDPVYAAARWELFVKADTIIPSKRPTI